MNPGTKAYFYKTAGFIFKIHLLNPILNIDRQGGSYRFRTHEPSKKTDYHITFDVVEELLPPAHPPLFQGESFEDKLIPYHWSVHRQATHPYIYLHFNQQGIQKLAATLELTNKQIDVRIQVQNKTEHLLLDPFFHPFGAILLQYLVQYHQGLLLHASGVADRTNGFVFTAVSGTGKSTMAKLWNQCGSQVINDDRLALLPLGNEVIMTNTPMPYYQDIHKECPVTAIFILKQAPQNSITPIPKALGVAKLMSNCIQSLYDTNQVKAHLEALKHIAKKCPIFEVGFKPTTEIVDLIRTQFG
jgi:hypothetical protein